jgi:hypothetical protein
VERYKTGGEATFAQRFLEQPSRVLPISAIGKHMLDSAGKATTTAGWCESLKTFFAANAEAKDRLLYGTDWSMLAIEDRWREYFGCLPAGVLAAAAAAPTRAHAEYRRFERVPLPWLAEVAAARNNRARLLQIL